MELQTVLNALGIVLPDITAYQAPGRGRSLPDT